MSEDFHERVSAVVERIEILVSAGNMRLLPAIRLAVEFGHIAREFSDGDTVAGHGLHVIETLLDALEAVQAAN